MAYDPREGRWATLDPAGYIDGSNRYQYERTEPLGSTDPSGLTVWTEDLGPFGALGQWRVGDGEAVIIYGNDFLDTVRSIPELREQLDLLVQDTYT